MPNHCENDLTIEGKVEEIKRFLEYAKGDPKDGDQRVLDYSKFIPYPQEFLEMDKEHNEWVKQNVEGEGGEFGGKLKEGADWKDCPKDGFNRGGYEWCIEHWATKWNAYDVTVDELEQWGTDAEGYICIHFNSAWAPPEPVIKKMGEMFPLLTFDLRYFEGGMGFNGMLRIENGKIEREKSGDYFGHRGG